MLAEFFEPLNPTDCVYQFGFAGKQGMAVAADVDVDSGLGGASGEGVAASTSNYCVIVPLGMDITFHEVDYITNDFRREKRRWR